MNEEHHPDVIEGRSLLTDIGVVAGPVIGAATGWALSQYGPGSDDSTSQPEAPKEIILPPGTAALCGCALPRQDFVSRARESPQRAIQKVA